MDYQNCPGKIRLDDLDKNITTLHKRIDVRDISRKEFHKEIKDEIREVKTDMTEMFEKGVNAVEKSINRLEMSIGGMKKETSQFKYWLIGILGSAVISLIVFVFFNFRP